MHYNRIYLRLSYSLHKFEKTITVDIIDVICRRHFRFGSLYCQSYSRSCILVVTVWLLIRYIGICRFSKQTYLDITKMESTMKYVV